MNFQDLSKRALEIRELYDRHNEKNSGGAWNRLQIAQGFAGDVGDLQKLAMAKDGLRSVENVDEKLTHELSDCLWSILVLADKYDIDLERGFMKTMDELGDRLSRGK